MEIIIFAILSFFLFTMALGCISSAPWVPSRKGLRDMLVRSLDLRPGAVVYDLGCGSGDVLFSVARAFPETKLIGYEIGFFPFLIAFLRKHVGGKKYKNVHIYFRDFFGQHFSDADVIFLFLMKKAYPKVLKKLQKEVRDDTIIAVEAWPFPSVTPEKVLEEKYQLRVFCYKGLDLRNEIMV